MEKCLETYFDVHDYEVPTREVVEVLDLVELEVLCFNHQSKEERDGLHGTSEFTVVFGDVFEKVL